MKGDLQKQTEHEASHEFLEVEFFMFLSQVGEETSQDIKPVMEGQRDMSLKIPLTESLGCGFALELPFLPVHYEYSGPMKWSKNITDELAAYIVLAVMFLDMFQVSRMIDDVHSKEGDRHLIRRPVSLVERVPGGAACSATGLKFPRIAFEWLSRRARNA